MICDTLGGTNCRSRRKKKDPLHNGLHVTAQDLKGAYFTADVKQKKSKERSRGRRALAPLKAPGSQSRRPRPPPPCAAAPHPHSRPSPPQSLSASCPSPAGPSERSGSTGPRTLRSS